jgi:hypothetical protein
MTSKDKAKLGLAAGLLLFALASFILSAPHKRKIPNVEEARTFWYCSACKNGFQLTGPQTAEMTRMRRPATPTSQGTAQPRRPGRDVIEITKCPFCGEWAGVPARRCPKCGETFAARAGNGAITACPRCGWDPTAHQPAGDLPAIGGP